MRQQAGNFGRAFAQPVEQRLSSVAVAFALIFTFPGVAQAAPPTAGEVGETLERPEPLRRPDLAPVTRKPAAESAVAAGGKQLVVNQFTFRGNSLFSDEQLREAVAPWTGRPITLIEIYDAADAVTRLYTENGYNLADCAVPAQKVSSGTVALEIIEGRIGAVGFEGTRRYDEDELRQYLRGAKAGEIYDGTEFEREMLIINELPGLSARAVLRPGEAYGASDIIVRAEEDGFSGSFVADNHSRATLGEWRGGVNLSIKNPVGDGDALQFALVHSESNLLNYGFVEYAFPVNHLGTRMKMSYGHADFSVGGQFAALGITGENRSGRIGVEHPLIRSRSRNLLLATGLSRTSSGSEVSGTALGGTRITLLETTLTFNQVYSNSAVTQVSLGYAGNFQSVDSNPENDQPGKINLGIQHLHPTHWNSQLLFRVTGGFSEDALVDTQKVSLGGPRSVRSYGPSEIRGDRGGSASVELRRGSPFLGRRLLTSFFIDTGYVERAQPAAGEKKRGSLSGYGIGFVIPLPLNSEFKLEAARPLGSRLPTDNERGARLWSSFKISF